MSTQWVFCEVFTTFRKMKITSHKAIDIKLNNRHIWLRGHRYTSSLVCFIGAYWNALGHDGHVVSKADLRGWSFSFTEATNGCCRGGVLHVTLALMLSHFAPEVVAVCTKWPLQHRHLCLSKRWEVTMKSAWQTKVDLVGTFGLKKNVHKTRLEELWDTRDHLSCVAFYGKQWMGWILMKFAAYFILQVLDMLWFSFPVRIITRVNQVTWTHLESRLPWGIPRKAVRTSEN